MARKQHGIHIKGAQAPAPLQVSHPLLFQSTPLPASLPTAAICQTCKIAASQQAPASCVTTHIEQLCLSCCFCLYIYVRNERSQLLQQSLAIDWHKWCAMQSFEELLASKVISSRLQHNLRASGFQEPTPIQRQAVPALMASRELLAAAPTGVVPNPQPHSPQSLSSIIDFNTSHYDRDFMTIADFRALNLLPS